MDGTHGSCGDNLDGDGAVNSVVESAVKTCVKTEGKLRDDRTSFLHRILRVKNDVLSSRSFHASFHGTFHDTSQ